MPPKKKKDQTKNNEEGDNAGKMVAEDTKKEIKQSKQPVAQQKLTQPKKQVKKSEDSKIEQPQIVKTDSQQLQKKISLQDNNNLSQAQVLQRRKMRFNLVGTQVNAQEAGKVAKERMEKFGSMAPETKEDLQKRKQKFAPPTALNLNEDQGVIEKRRQKFGGVSTSQAAEDPSQIQQRKKKFGTNVMSLDDLIQKDKQNRRNHHHKDNLKSKPYHNNNKNQDRFDRSRQKRHRR